MIFTVTSKPFDEDSEFAEVVVTAEGDGVEKTEVLTVKASQKHPWSLNAAVKMAIAVLDEHPGR